MRLRTEKQVITVEYEDSKTTVEMLGPRDMARLKKRYVTFDRRGNLDPESEERYSFELFNQMVKGWEGMEGLECNRENKRKVYECDQPYAGAIISSALDQMEERTERGELEAKN